jgi:DNA-binding protein YbaB
MQDPAEQMEQILRSFKQTRERLTEARARAREAYGSARSRDHLIECTVGPDGQITNLTISPRAMEDYDAARLAATIQDVIAEANAQLRAYLAEQSREVFGESFDPEALAEPDAAMEAIKTMRDRLRGG